MSVSLIGKDGTGIATNANPVPVQLSTTLPNEIAYSAADFTLDSFERARMSDARIVFESTFAALTPTLATTIWEVGTVGAGTSEALTTNLYGTQLIQPVTTSVGRFIQSINHIRYAPGVSSVMRFTFQTGILPTGARHRVGMFTDQGTYPSTAGDGFFFENDATALAFVRRYMTQGATGGEERVLQSSWNLDKCNGTGASGYNMDMSKAQHLVVEYQWLGVGTIRFGWETGPSGIVWAHEMHNVNITAESWSRTGTLPVRAETYNYAASNINQLTVINCVVLQEGDVADLRGWRYFGSAPMAPKVTGLTALAMYPITGLKAAATNDLTKRTRIIPTQIIINVTTVGTQAANAGWMVGLMMNGTPNTSATFAVTMAGSTTVQDIAVGSTTAATGTLTWSGMLPNAIGVYTFDLTTMNDNANVIGFNAAGSAAITGSANLMLVCAPLTTATVGLSLSASINWKEIV